MTLADVQQQRLLERLREAGDQPVAFAELHAAGVDFPAAVISELELGGYIIARVYDHGRLVGPRTAGRRAPARSRTSGHTRRTPAAVALAAPIGQLQYSAFKPLAGTVKATTTLPVEVRDGAISLVG
jgi:hypothetical protein